MFQGAEGLLAAASTLGRPLEEFGNDERVEALWAIKAMEHAEVYFNVKANIARCRKLILTKYLYLPDFVLGGS